MKYEDLKRIDVECAYTGRGFLGAKRMERAKLVLVDGMKQADVARALGVSRETVSSAVRRTRRGAQKLGIVLEI